jgi:hypothetical protein
MAIAASAHDILGHEHVQSEDKYAAETTQLSSVSEADTDRLCLLTHRAFGPFHCLRNPSHRRSRFGMSLELPNIVFGPWISDGGFLLWHVHWSWWSDCAV